MNIDVIRTSELDTSLLRRWMDIVAANSDLRNPYFAVEFTLAVGMVRDDVYVGLVREGPEIIGFFPFQRGQRGTGRPVGGPFSQRQGFVVCPEAAWSADELIRGCGLSLWQFDHVIAPQKQFQPWRKVLTSAPIVDLQEGYAAYTRARRHKGSHQLVELAQKRLEFEQEAGPLRFEPHTPDVAILHRLLDWKSHEYIESGQPDAFRYPWAQGLLEHILEMQSAAFGGVLSALYADDCLVAVHMGMRSSTVWHYWFAACDVGFARYSPNLLLFEEMTQNAEAMGIDTIDMGACPDEYRRPFATGIVPLVEGCVEMPSFARTLHAARQKIGNFAMRPPALAFMDRPVRALRNLEARSRFR